MGFALEDGSRRASVSRHDDGLVARLCEIWNEIEKVVDRVLVDVEHADEDLPRVASIAREVRIAVGCQLQEPAPLWRGVRTPRVVARAHGLIGALIMIGNVPNSTDERESLAALIGVCVPDL